MKIIKRIVTFFFIVILSRANFQVEEKEVAQVFEIDQYGQLNFTIKVTGENITAPISLINWREQQLKQIKSGINSDQNLNLTEYYKGFELIIEGKFKQFQKNWLQLPLLCLKNDSVSLIHKPQKIPMLKIDSIECDFYSYKLNEQRIRMSVDMSLLQNTSIIYFSIFNITNLRKNKDQLPEGEISLEEGYILPEINSEEIEFWEIDVQLSIIASGQNAINCGVNGIFNQTQNKCFCSDRFVGQFCELEIKQVGLDFHKEILLEPLKFDIYSIKLEQMNTMLLTLNGTILINFALILREDSYETIQQKVLESFFFSRLQISPKDQQQQGIQLPFNSSTSELIFWFRNEQSQFPVSLELSFTESSFDLSIDFISSLISYLLFTLMGGLLVCGCCFFMIFLVRKLQQKWQMQQRRKKIEKQLPVMRFSRYLNNTSLSRDNPISICSVCLGDFDEEDLVRVTKCRHVFHSECIEEWVVKKNQCPNCRESIFDREEIINNQNNESLSELQSTNPLHLNEIN